MPKESFKIPKYIPKYPYNTRIFYAIKTNLCTIQFYIYCMAEIYTAFNSFLHAGVEVGVVSKWHAGVGVGKIFPDFATLKWPTTLY